MLHENPLMIDVDVDQWRNLQNMFLISAREKKRIIVIHENGVILKYRHSHGEHIVRSVSRILDPFKDARKIYEDNRDKADFVLIIERGAAEKYVTEFQDAWKAEEDLDEYIYRMYNLLEKYREGIVTYPGSPAENLGLQLRTGITYLQLKSAINKYVPPMTTVVLGIFNGPTSIFTSLVVGFDTNKKVRLITTLDRSLITTNWRIDYKKAVEWVERKYWKCSIGLFTEKETMEKVLASKRKIETLWRLAKKQKVIIDPISESLKYEFMWLELHSIS